MLRFSTGKIVATIGFIVIGLLLAVPSLFSPQQRQGFVQSIPSWVPGWMVPTRAIVLGLDLQGGSHVLLEVDVADLDRGRTVLGKQPATAPGAPVAFTGLGRAAARSEVTQRPAGHLRTPTSTSGPAPAGARGGAADLTVIPARPGRSDIADQPGGLFRSRRPAGAQRRVRRRRAVDRGHSPARRRLGTDRADHPAPGRRPDRGAGAGLEDPSG